MNRVPQLSSFGQPCISVVTFVLYRSAGKSASTAETDRKRGRTTEKRMYEVEALPHNTLQEVMGE